MSDNPPQQTQTPNDKFEENIQNLINLSQFILVGHRDKSFESEDIVPILLFQLRFIVNFSSEEEKLLEDNFIRVFPRLVHFLLEILTNDQLLFFANHPIGKMTLKKIDEVVISEPNLEKKFLMHRRIMEVNKSHIDDLVIEVDSRLNEWNTYDPIEVWNWFIQKFNFVAEMYSEQDGLTTNVMEIRSAFLNFYNAISLDSVRLLAIYSKSSDILQKIGDNYGCADEINLRMQ